MNERERIEAVYELGGTKAIYGHEDIIVIVPPLFLSDRDCRRASGGANI
jgi:hypothetical protein